MPMTATVATVLIAVQVLVMTIVHAFYLQSSVTSVHAGQANHIGAWNATRPEGLQQKFLYPLPTSKVQAWSQSSRNEGSTCTTLLVHSIILMQLNQIWLPFDEKRPWREEYLKEEHGRVCRTQTFQVDLQCFKDNSSSSLVGALSQVAKAKAFASGASRHQCK